MTSNLPTLSQTCLVKKESNYELSVYSGELTPRCVAINVKKMQQSFPALTDAFYEIFTERLKANNYCDNRLNDAIEHVIDNCIYPTPTIAQFISFDKRIKLYDYNQVLKLNEELGGKAFELYRPVRIGENVKPVYARVNDIKEFNLELWKK